MIKPLCLVILQDIQKVIILIPLINLNKSTLNIIDKFSGIFSFKMFQRLFLLRW